MKRNILFISLLLLSTSVLANGKWYAGIGFGQSTPQLGIDKDIEDYFIDIPYEYGGGKIDVDVNVDSSFESYGHKIFIGYDVGKRKEWAFELSTVNLGNYEAVVQAAGDGRGSHDDVDYPLSVVAQEKVKANFNVTTFSVIYLIEIGNRISIFPRFGLSYIKGNIVIEDNIAADISSPTDNLSGHWIIENKKERLTGILPVFGIGMDIGIDKNNFIRTEFERYGHPTEEYVDMATISWLRKF